MNLERLNMIFDLARRVFSEYFELEASLFLFFLISSFSNKVLPPNAP